MTFDKMHAMRRVVFSERKFDTIMELVWNDLKFETEEIVCCSYDSVLLVDYCNDDKLTEVLT